MRKIIDESDRLKSYAKENGEEAAFLVAADPIVQLQRENIRLRSNLAYCFWGGERMSRHKEMKCGESKLYVCPECGCHLHEWEDLVREVDRLKERLKMIEEVYKRWSDPLLVFPITEKRGEEAWQAIQQVCEMEGEG